MFDFTVLVLPGCYASSVALTIDMLAAAATLAPGCGVATPRWRVLSAGGARIDLGAGMSLDAKPLPRSPRDDGAVWVVPGLGISSPRHLSKRLAQHDAQAALRALRIHAGRGGTVAASCSAVFLLQAAGLLAGRRATTSWWLASSLRDLEPSCTVDANRMVCADGQVVTAGAALAQSDLMLHLLRTRFGAPLAKSVSRMLLVDGREAQAPFVVPEMLANGDELVARLIDRVTAAMPNPPSISQLASEFGMSDRTLARHIRARTGQSSLALVQSVRLNRARMLLESSRMSVEQVAEQVGYSDATALWRMMRRVTGMTPRQLRSSHAGMQQD